MKQVFLFSLLMLGARLTSAQDTTYLDSSYKPVVKDNASYCRVVRPADNDLYRAEIYFKSGKLQSVTHYKDKELNFLEGKAIYYYANGNTDAQGSYRNNVKHGSWRFYFPSGKESGFMFFKEGKIATADYLERYGHMMDEDNDAMPSFKGGKEALIEYIRNTFNPVQKDAKEKIKGVVKVGFVVSETGKVTNAHIVSGINEKINQQALKLINGMPDWHPGMQYDKPVKVPLVIPIVF